MVLCSVFSGTEQLKPAVLLACVIAGSGPAEKEDKYWGGYNYLMLSTYKKIWVRITLQGLTLILTSLLESKQTQEPKLHCFEDFQHLQHALDLLS